MYNLIIKLFSIRHFLCHAKFNMQKKILCCVCKWLHTFMHPTISRPSTDYIQWTKQNVSVQIKYKFLAESTQWQMRFCTRPSADTTLFFSLYSTTESTDHMPCTWQCSTYKKYKFHAVSAHGWMQVGIIQLADTALIISRIHSTDESIVYVHGNAQHTKYKFPWCPRYWLNAVLHRTISGHSIYHSSCMQHWCRHRLNTMYVIKLNTQTHLSCCIWQWSGAVRNPAKADTALVIAHEHSADGSIGHAPSTWQSSGYKMKISMLRLPMIECSLADRPSADTALTIDHTPPTQHRWKHRSYVKYMVRLGIQNIISIPCLLMVKCHRALDQHKAQHWPYSTYAAQVIQMSAHGWI